MRNKIRRCRESGWSSRRVGLYGGCRVTGLQVDMTLSSRKMSHQLVEKAKTELEQAQSQLDSALRAWDASVSELWRTSIALTQAQKRMTHAHELLRRAVDATTPSHSKPRRLPDRGAAMLPYKRAKE